MLGKKPEMDEGIKTTAREISKQESAWTLTDQQMVTKPKLPTRKFLTAAGMVLATGALAVVSGAQTTPQTPDPDKTKADSAAAQTQKAKDPDKKKAGHPDAKKKTGAKAADPDKAKQAKTKAAQKPADPDAAKK